MESAPAPFQQRFLDALFQTNKSGVPIVPVVLPGQEIPIATLQLEPNAWREAMPRYLLAHRGTEVKHAAERLGMTASALAEGIAGTDAFFSVMLLADALSGEMLKPAALSAVKGLRIETYRPCPECGTIFSRDAHNKRYCSDTCDDQARAAADRDRSKARSLKRSLDRAKLRVRKLKFNQDIDRLLLQGNKSLWRLVGQDHYTRTRSDKACRGRLERLARGSDKHALADRIRNL
jgi:hypothetical protein